MKETCSKLIIVLAAIFSPAVPLLVTVGVLCLADLVTGILVSHKQGKKFRKSAAIRRTLGKILVYDSVILLAFVTQKYLTGDTIPACSIVASMAGLAELISCLENINILSGGTLLKGILKKLGSHNDQ